jgi:hypothetical protein
MNILDRIIYSKTADALLQYWVYFTIGFTILAIIFGILNFGMNILILLTVKGIEVPTGALFIVSVIVFLIGVVIGYIFRKYDIQSRIQSFQNRTMNPEIDKINKVYAEVQKISDEVVKLKQLLEEMKT